MIALYVRVSTAEQAKEGYSIDEQTARLKKYCEAHGRTDYVVYTDAGMSGANMQRAGLEALLADVRAGKVDRVVVYKLDRLSRSQKDALYLIEDAFMANGVDFESMTERFDTGTSFGRAMVGILAVFAQLEREQIKERMKLGREGRAKSGKYHCSGRKPTGYDIKDGALYINEYEALQIREAFERYAGGESLRAIVRDFIQKGYTTKNGSWSDGLLYNILVNPLYTGRINSNGMTYAGIHEPIVSDALFNQVQKQRRGTNKSKKGESWAANNMLLGGRVWCKRCGARYCAYSVKIGGKDYGYYTCYSQRGASPLMVRDPNCKNKRYSARELDMIILGEIKKLEIDADYIRQLSSAGNAQKEAQAREKAIAAELKKIDEQKNRLIDLYTVGGIDKAAVTQRVDALNKREKDLRAQLQAAQDKAPRISPQKATQAVKGFADMVARGNHAQIAAIISELVDRVEIDGDDVFIYWNFV